MKYRVVTVTNNLRDYSEYEDDTLEFPELVKRIGDEFGTFVVEVDGDNWWEAREFFDCVEITEFEVRL